jgi:carbamoylphosphate synthase small subunit
VDEASIRKNRNVKITGYNVNDNTVEAVTCEKLGIISVQYYPYSPGFNEVNETFIKFLKMLNNRKGLKHA